MEYWILKEVFRQLRIHLQTQLFNDPNRIQNKGNDSIEEISYSEKLTIHTWQGIYQIYCYSFVTMVREYTATSIQLAIL